MIEIITFDNKGNKISSAECTLNASIDTARTLWNDGIK
jgi:hypothetical protein